MATSVLPSPVTISAMSPPCRTMPPMNWTSKCRMFEEPPARLAAGGERLGQQVVERLARRPGGGGTRRSWPAAPHPKAPASAGSSSLIVRDDRPHLPDPPLVRAAEQPDQPLGNPLREGRERVGRLIPNLGQHFHCRVNPMKFPRPEALSLLKLRSYNRLYRSVKPIGFGP